MRLTKTHKAVVIIALLLTTALPADSPRAQASHDRHAQNEALSPEALEATYSSRRALIGRELAGLSVDEWAGEYHAQDGPTAGTQFSWSPAAGFVVKWSTCCHGWRERVNYGRAAFEGGALKLEPELSGKGVKVYPVAAPLIPVRWGEQHYLIPSDQIINFCYAAKNFPNSPEVEAFFLKDADKEKRRVGLPRVPAEYRKYLQSKPLVAVVSQVKPKARPWSQEFILNVGRADGVVDGMKFYLSSPRNIFMLVEVTEVGERTSSAYVIMSGHRNGSENEIRPRAGWRLTSRAPRDASSYFPG